MGSASTFAGTSNEQASFLIVPISLFSSTSFRRSLRCAICSQRCTTDAIVSYPEMRPRRRHTADAIGDPSAPSPPLSASTTAQDHDKSVTIAQALSDLYGDSTGDKAGSAPVSAP